MFDCYKNFSTRVKSSTESSVTHGIKTSIILKATNEMKIFANYLFFNAHLMKCIPQIKVSTLYSCSTYQKLGINYFNVKNNNF